jgi:hypothetical protein
MGGAVNTGACMCPCCGLANALTVRSNPVTSYVRHGSQPETKESCYATDGQRADVASTGRAGVLSILGEDHPHWQSLAGPVSHTGRGA